MSNLDRIWKLYMAIWIGYGIAQYGLFMNLK